jgi:hypothetical protein
MRELDLYPPVKAATRESARGRLGADAPRRTLRWGFGSV